MFHKKSDSLLAIDFGSSNSVACLFRNGQVQLVADNTESGVNVFPSFVEYKGDEVLTGTIAKKRRLQGAKYCVGCIKRLLGLTWEDYEALENKDVFGCEVVRGDDGYPQFIVSDSGRQVSAIEVASELFRKIKADADRRNGAPISECYVTVPANYKDHQREAIKAAARDAGLTVNAIVIEPTAAAMSWCLDHEKSLSVGEKMLVVDFGGGTFDLSLLKCDGNGSFSVMDTNGDPKMGGNDVDIEIAKEVCKMVKNTEGISFNPLKTKKKMRFLAVCEEAKIQLATNKATEIDLSDFNPDLDEITFTQQQLNDIVKRLFMKRIDECISRITNKPDRTIGVIKKVFMVGGSSQLQAVREGVKKCFPHAVFPDINPETSVAEGALGIARGGVVHEIINFSFGLLAGNDVVMLLNKGTRIPCESGPITFCNSTDYPEKIFSAIYQWNGSDSNQSGRVMKPMNECTKVREYSFMNDNPLPKGQQIFDIVFRLEFGGTLEVICKDKNTGRILNREVYKSLVARE